MLRFKKSIHIGIYVKRLIIHHIGYLVALICFIFLLFSFVPLQIKQYMSMRSELQETNEEIVKLSQRQAVIQQYPADQLADLTLTLNTLYPSIEDRFSIFTALDNLQAVSGVGVISYSSPFAGKTRNEITIGVKATGDLQTFRRFLQTHIFRSGRFMTVSKLIFNNDGNSIVFTASFYSKNIDIGSRTATEYSPDAIIRLNEIQREVESAGLVRRTTSTDDSAIPLDYTTKDNPFE